PGYGNDSRPARRVAAIGMCRRRSGEAERGPQAALRSSGGTGPSGRSGGWHPRPAPCDAATRRTSARLQFPARTVATEGFELGEVSVRISRFTRTITDPEKEASDELGGLLGDDEARYGQQGSA